jgi:hypothetical protein
MESLTNLDFWQDTVTGIEVHEGQIRGVNMLWDSESKRKQ